MLPYLSPVGDFLYLDKRRNGTVTIEANAFENVREIKVVDAHNCTTIGKEAFKGCASLIQIRLAGNCTIDPTAFDPNQVIYVFAPAGGRTEAFCNGDNNLIFIEEATTQE